MGQRSRLEEENVPPVSAESKKPISWQKPVPRKNRPELETVSNTSHKVVGATSSKGFSSSQTIIFDVLSTDGLSQTFVHDAAALVLMEFSCAKFLKLPSKINETKIS